MPALLDASKWARADLTAWGHHAALPCYGSSFSLTQSLYDWRGGSGHVHSRPCPGTHTHSRPLPGTHTHSRPCPGTHGGSYVLLIPLQSGETAGDLQQGGRSELGAASDETPGVLNPEAEERVITHLLEEPEEPGRVGKKTGVTHILLSGLIGTPPETQPFMVDAVYPWSLALILA